MDDWRTRLTDPDDHGDDPYEGKNPAAVEPEGEDFKLGTWVSHRRAEYQKGKQPADRVAELEAIESWVWDVKNADFRDTTRSHPPSSADGVNSGHRSVQPFRRVMVGRSDVESIDPDRRKLSEALHDLVLEPDDA